MSGSLHEHVAEWDGAYVLGALSAADRRTFERHLEDCARCREAVAELAPMPGLLAQIRPDRLETSADGPAGDAPPAGPPPTEPAVPPRRPRRRVLTLALAAAAALVLAITLPLALREREDGAALTVSPSAPSGQSVPMRVDVALTPASWGTALSITCDYPQAAAGPGGGYGPGGPPPSYALVVTAEDGTRSQVSSWQGVPGEVVTLEAGTAVDLADIARLEVVDAAGTAVLSAEVEGSRPGG